MTYTPLAERLRPKSLDDVIGQAHLLGPKKPLRVLFEAQAPQSFLFWGPPGVGKTTLARLYGERFQATYDFVSVSSVTTGVPELKKIFAQAQEVRPLGRGTILFVDEIHRFNKTQQDAFLPHVESGTIVLLGATTENPSFELNRALLSRCPVFRLVPLTPDEMTLLLTRAEEALQLPLTPEGKEALFALAGGDARFFLGLLEQLSLHTHDGPLGPDELHALLPDILASYDKRGDQHYDFISVLHKAVRGSDPQGALYWFARMLQGGENPLYIGRRLVRMASEDIGLADPHALGIAVHACEAYERLGSPEGELALAECVLYLATAPKSNAVYMAFKQAQAAAEKTRDAPPPLHAVNAPTALMKSLGHGANYRYDHDFPHAYAGQEFLPEVLLGGQFYTPVARGFERDIQKRLEFWQKLRETLF